ncbi:MULTISPECIES: glycine oxidase ThiO [Prauserella salsuginis group]|uniref:glycine oxidase n=2 Tax=Prauserella salsuginis group TaxID=2893672 RepID=A0A839XR51_9PSEU|nr:MULTISPECIES: glycine oxidase ThiO [Prauserella salsuginis group]MBB3663408.1 glycine oxidase [Prauserella sediminis]MCR3720768.1 glycine oxidase [Prauserella flava]MCR3735151.1 glycine oxidase [Prauserella salsuginis]
MSEFAVPASVAGATEVAVVGGGVVGLAVAWRAVSAGHRVTLFDPAPERAASRVAGGMLAPVTEAWPGEEDVLELGEESLRRWPAFAGELTACGHDPALSTSGTVVAAFDRADAETLHTLAGYLHELGREATYVPARQLRRIEPGLAGAVTGGLVVPGDLAVDTRRLLAALHDGAASRGAVTVPEEVVAVEPGVVRTARGEYPAGAIVVAAGAWSRSLLPDVGAHIRPLKGEVLRLRSRRTTLPPPSGTLRAMVEGEPVYLVPRGRGESADGDLVVGATQYEAGFDTAVTARGVRRLLDAAERVFPGIAEYELVETAAGLRAGSADNLPLLGEVADGVYAATGHHRGGLLLAPVTADAVVAWLAGGEPPPGVAAAHPDRVKERVS